MRPALKAHRWHLCLLAAAVVGLVGYLSRASFVRLPFIQETVPTRILVGIVAVTIAVTPLYPGFPELAPTLMRERAVRAVRPLGTVGLALVAYAPSAVEAPGARSDTLYFAALLTVGLLSVVAVGHLAWAIILTLGFTALLINASPGSPVTALLERGAPTLLTVGVPTGAVLASVLGPRRWKSLD